MSVKEDGEKVAKELQEDGYYDHLRVLEDGTVCGTGRLLFTCALYVGLTGAGWERRYCYPNEALATKALGGLNTGDDEPIDGFVARRPEPIETVAKKCPRPN